MAVGWFTSAFNEGKAEGIAEGETRGEAKGKEEGVADQYNEDLQTVAGIYRDQGYSEEKALEMAKEKLKKVSA